MKKLKITALLMAILMLAACFVSCNKDASEGGDDVADSTNASVSDTDAGDDAAVGETVLGIADAKGSAGLTGDFKAAFSDETGAENVITGEKGSTVCYSIYAALSSPAKITQILLRSPSEQPGYLAGATIEASADGENWTVITQLGSSVVKNKTYTLEIDDESVYTYIRVRQADGKRLGNFRFRSMVIKGIPQDGAAGDIAKIVEEKDPSKVLSFAEYISSNEGTGDVADAFIDNDKSWTADARLADKPNYVICSLSKKTEIFRVVVKLKGGNNSMEGTVVQGTTNGQEWTDLCTVSKNTSDSAEISLEINDQTLYSHLRLVQKKELAQNKWTLDSVLIYGVESDEAAEELPVKFIIADTLRVTYNAGLSNVKPKTVDMNPATIWDVTNYNTYYRNDVNPEFEGGKTRIAGEFKHATEITKLIYHNPPAVGMRIRGSFIDASVDGENWDTIAIFPGSRDIYDLNTQQTVEINVESTQKYKYIRIRHADGMHAADLDIGVLEVIGVQYNESGEFVQDGYASAQ